MIKIQFVSSIYAKIVECQCVRIYFEPSCIFNNPVLIGEIIILFNRFMGLGINFDWDYDRFLKLHTFTHINFLRIKKLKL
jgi:hypothetical protein